MLGCSSLGRCVLVEWITISPTSLRLRLYITDVNAPKTCTLKETFVYELSWCQKSSIAMKRKKIVNNYLSDFSWTSSISASSYPNPLTCQRDFGLDGVLYSVLHKMVDSRNDNRLSYHIIKYDSENIVHTMTWTCWPGAATTTYLLSPLTTTIGCGWRYG